MGLQRMREAVFYPFTLKAYLMASTKVGFVRELRQLSGEAGKNAYKY